MNAGPPPPRPEDDASDPLLAALRQRLSDYGQAPPPGAWAAIREQLPTPRPWWQRPRLLPLLLLLLGAIVATTTIMLRGQLTRRGQVATAERQPAKASTTSTFSDLPRKADPATGPATAAPATVAGSAAPARPSSFLPSADTAAAVATTSRFGKPAATQAASAALPAKRGGLLSKNAATGVEKLPFAAKGPGHRARSGQALKSPRLTQASTRQQTSSTPLAERPVRQISQPEQLVKESSTTTYPIAPPAAASRPGTARGRRHFALSRRPTTSGSPKRRHLAPLAAPRTAAGHRALASAGAPRTSAPSQPPSSSPNLTASRRAPAGLPGQVDSLALRIAALGLPTAWPGPVLAARPDSAQPALPRVRRWSVLVLAGPTLSYRTLGPAPTLTAQHPDFARLERPALGLGAQVQVRRVLSGRWALGLGLGYHEYATRLALSIIDSSSRSSRLVHQRDAYRVLTLPVQLSYALGPPRGRLSQALLLGIEPSWYLGGRSTEGSDCGCQQQTYTATSPRPYRTWSVAASLGLDLRYRLGGEAARWQWLVQPTARYIITPFVRSDAPDFTRRQPFSLGLLTGFSWDIR